jgi:hypothetical protein
MLEWQQLDGADRIETIKLMTSTDFGEFQSGGDARATLKEREREEGRAAIRPREALTGIHTIVGHNVGALGSCSAKLFRPKL